MAHIKCRYIEPRCIYGDYSVSGCICHHPYDGGACEYFEDHWRENEKIIVSDWCRYARESTVVFERDYKRFHYDSDGLEIGRKFIDSSDIKYLEIDGQVLIDESEVEE